MQAQPCVFFPESTLVEQEDKINFLEPSSSNYGIAVRTLLRGYPGYFCSTSHSEGQEPESIWRELGNEAFWTLSSCKDGNGIHQLRDNDEKTFWQSDGVGPHSVTLHFDRRVQVKRVDLLLNARIDESYTPHQVAIRLGNSERGLQTVKEERYHPDAASRMKRCEWFAIDLSGCSACDCGNDSHGPQGFCLQVLVLSNYQNGRDTHIRQIRVYGPPQHGARCMRVYRSDGYGPPNRQSFSH